MPIFDVTIAMRDAYNRRTRKTFQVNSVDFATAQSDTSSLVTDLAALSGLEILTSSVAAATDVSDAVTAEANKDEGLTLQYDLGAGKSASSKVPGPIKTIFDENGNADLADVLVSNYTDNFVGGPFLISDGEQAIGVNKGTLDK